jgi:hypothetical protein
MTFVVEQFRKILRPDGEFERLKRTREQAGAVATPWWRYPLASLLLAVGLTVAVSMAVVTPIYAIGRQRCLDGESYFCLLAGGVPADVRGCGSYFKYNTWVLNRQTSNWTEHKSVDCIHEVRQVPFGICFVHFPVL